MEKVTAYMSYNGKLFHTEEQCLKYEKKHAQYPKRGEYTIAADDVASGDNIIKVDIVKHTIITQNTPSSEKKKEVFYIVGGRYKMTGCDDAHMLHGCLGGYGKNPYDYWGTADIAVANRILDGDEIDSHSLSEICDEFKKYDKYSKMTFTVIEPLKKWKIEDVRWHTGSIKMNTVTIEYIKER